MHVMHARAHTHTHVYIDTRRMSALCARVRVDVTLASVQFAGSRVSSIERGIGSMFDVASLVSGFDGDVVTISGIGVLLLLSPALVSTTLAGCSGAAVVTSVSTGPVATDAAEEAVVRLAVDSTGALEVATIGNSVAGGVVPDSAAGANAAVVSSGALVVTIEGPFDICVVVLMSLRSVVISGAAFVASGWIGVAIEVGSAAAAAAVTLFGAAAASVVTSGLTVDVV